MKDKQVMLLDVGANVDCKPINLVHFALMGSVYMKSVGVKDPKVALLNVGTEDEKGNELASIIDKPEEKEVEYEYHLGDKVYIGADEYEILNIGIFNVVLYDYQYPLFNREMSKEEFDRKVRENPCNYH